MQKKYDDTHDLTSLMGSFPPFSSKVHGIGAKTQQVLETMTVIEKNKYEVTNSVSSMCRAKVVTMKKKPVKLFFESIRHQSKSKS